MRHRRRHRAPPQNLYKKFIKDEKPPKEFFEALGSDRDYNVDLIPKFIMANGACACRRPLHCRSTRGPPHPRYNPAA